jgi:hypothetical protein
MDARTKKHRMALWLVFLFFVLPSIANAEAQCTPTQISSFQTKCDAYGAYVASLESDCVARYGSHYLCGYYPLPSQVRPIPDGYVCVVTWIRSPSGLEGPIPSLTDNVYTLNCSTLTITLSGGTEVEPSDDSTTSTLPIIASVIDQSTRQPPTNPVKVHVSLTVDPKTGGHDHGNSDRPRGGVADVETCASDSECWTSPQPTDGNGQVVFNFNAPEASGTHTITAACDGCSNTATKPVDVKVDDLWPISVSTYYALTEDGSSKIIGSTTEHSSNHYISSEAQQKLWTLAMDFYNYQLRSGVTKPTLLHLNDASLKWGGLFDKDGDWVPEHKEHRRGSVIDVRANSTSGAIPPELFKKYIELAKKSGIDPHLEYIGDPINQHFHTRLLNRKE